MRYLLDTNAWVDYLNQRYPGVAERVRSANPDELALSAVALAELRYGADKSQHPARNHARIDVIAREVPLIDFDAAAAAAFGRLRSLLERQDEPIGSYDMLIASQAISRDLVLITDNVSEFRRIRNLKLENWRRDAP